MNIRKAWLAAVIAGAIGFIALGADAVVTQGAESAAGARLGPGSTLWIEGKSNMHDFESRTTTVVVKFKRDSSASAPTTPAEWETLVRGSHVQGLDVEIPVTSLRSGKAGLDKNLWQDLKADAHPAIQFHLAKYTAREAKHDTIAISAEGALRIAGREKQVTLHAHACRVDAGLWIDGSQELQMTDFGIKPRTMMLGALRVKNEVVVHYHLLLIPSKD